MARKHCGLIGEIADFDYHGNWGDYVSPRSVKAFLDSLAADDVAELEINSPGGSVVHGIEIANAVKNCKAHVVAHVTGIAASMASVIACACDEIEMEEASFMMIHDPWSYASGNAEELRKQASVLDQMKAVIMSFYRGKFKGKTDEEISALMADETWYTGNECRENGLVCTVIASDVRAAASIVGHKFAHMPDGAAKFLSAKELTDEGKAEIEKARAEAVAASVESAASPAPSAPTQTPADAATVDAPAASDDWEARYKGASKKINELNAKLADVADTAKVKLDEANAKIAELTAKVEKAALESIDYGTTCEALDKAVNELNGFNDQVKAAGFENLAALIGAVSGFKADLEKSAKDLADTREQLEHMKSTRDLLTGGVLCAKPETYAAQMDAAKTPEQREHLRAMKKAGKIQ